MNKLKAFFGFTQDDDISQDRDDAEPVISLKPSRSGSIFSKQSDAGLAEIKVVEPRIYEDSLNIATYLREQKPVIINLVHLDAGSGKRLIDFVCGTAYAISGHMMKIGESIFLFTPASVLISDDGERDTFDRGLNREQSPSFFHDRV